MPVAIRWTPEMHRAIVDGRSAGRTWAQIGASLGMNERTVIDRARRTGISTSKLSPRKDNTVQEASLIALKAILDVPYFPPEEGPPHRTCQWISGDLRGGGHMCGDATKPGKSYCAFHHSGAVFIPKKRYPGVDLRHHHA